MKSTNVNGLTVITENIPTAMSVAVGVYVRVGSHHERKNLGIAHFIEHMMFKGTEKRKSEEIFPTIENLGGWLNAETSYQYTSYYCKVPADHWMVGAELLGDMIFNHTLPQEELEKERTVILEELAMYNDDASDYCRELLIRSMNPKYEHRQLIAGTKESVNKITRDDMTQFIADFYTPSNMFFVAVGKVDHDKLVTFVKRNFKFEDRAAQKSNDPFKPIKLNGKTVEDSRNCEQTNMAWGMWAPAVTHEDFLPFKVIGNILGGPSSSKLNLEIREKRGLAYTVSFGSVGLNGMSLAIGYAGFNKNNLNTVKDIVLEQTLGLASKKVSEEELEKFKTYLKGSLMLSLESTSSLSDFIGNAHLFNKNPDPQEYIKQIDNITPEDISRVANKYLKQENIMFSVVNPK